jgi:hypothetical protein
MGHHAASTSALVVTAAETYLHVTPASAPTHGFGRPAWASILMRMIN